MPELPEVETIKNDLSPLVSGRTVSEVSVGDSTAIQKPSVAEFRKGITGRKIVELGRRGKYLLLHLNNGSTLIAHMRMTGNLMALPSGTKLPKQLETARLRVVIKFDDGGTLMFIDRRRMGRMWLVTDEKEVVGKLGPEPLTDDFTVAALSSILAKRKSPIKAVLCDQEAIAGVGNMYADEALFESGIHPMTPADEISPAKLKRLHSAIRRILAQAIENKGASVDTYFRPDGNRGAAHYQFKVAHRFGQTCPGCGGKVERIRIRGRGTYFCSKCQKPRHGKRV